MKLTAIKKLEGTITLRSGLHIGSGNMEMRIGGTDSPVIKHPHTLDPYIPGSSLKGKVRSLLEMASGLMMHTGGTVVAVKHLNKLSGADRAKAEAIVKIFGSGGDDKNEDAALGPTRVSFSDCYLDPQWKEKARANRWQLSEVKSENSINRIKGTAENPRFIERVPEGTQFAFQLTFRVLNEGDEALFDEVLKGLKLLELDALGGSGSRGYGRVQLTGLKLNAEDVQPKFDVLNPFSGGE
ncbi:MAG TPA: type III-A CRISPR-associated RAMP protein Csm3 [Dissulfurispiraceae bacterium]|nr:type III-A CRISPR-associated RAMP protein Csm3 [Dissulfurispiraceae bacterium]